MSVSTSIPKGGRMAPARLLVLILATAAVIAAAAWAVGSYVLDTGSRPGRPAVSSPASVRPAIPSVASIVRSLTPQERRYVQGMARLSDKQIAAAFGTTTKLK